MEQETSKRSKKSSNNKPYRKYLVGLAALLVLAGGGFFGYTYWKNMQSSPEVQAAQAEEEKQAILGQLSKLMVVPEGDPVLFKVSNEEVMRQQQAFFKDAKNDDVLLVFQASGKAIIFRPSQNMIVNAGPVNFDQTQGTNSPVPAGSINTEVNAEADKK